MTELSRPIVGPLTLSTQGESAEQRLSFDLSAGLEYLVPTSFTEEGNGYQLRTNFYNPLNARDSYGLGAEYDSAHTNGGDFYKGENYWRLSAIVSRGENKGYGISQQNLYTGFGEAGGHTTLQLGSDIFSPIVIWKTGGKSGFGIRPYLGTISSFSSDETVAEDISTLQLRLGIDLRYLFLENSNAPIPEGLTDYDVAWYHFGNVHRFALNYVTGKSLTRPAGLGRDYTDELFGEEGLPSARTEDAGFFNVINFLGAGSEDGNELRLQLKANDDQQTWMAGAKVLTSAGYFGINAPAQGFAGALELAHWGIAESLDLSLKTRRTLSSKTKKEKARNFLLGRALVNTLALGIGWAGQSEKLGRALLQGAQQAMIATTLHPDPAETRLAEGELISAVYESTNNSGNYLGLQLTTSLPSAHLYTGARFLVQTVPGSDFVQDEWIDPATGRNPLYEGAKAKISASLGFETKTGPLVLRAGALTLLAYGEGTRPVPGVGLEQQALLRFEVAKKADIEVGAGLTESSIGGTTTLGASAFGGLRLSFF